MQKLKRCLAAALMILILCFLPKLSLAVTWEFGTYGEGTNPFTPRGYVIATENGYFWLSSLFDNSTEDTLYTGNKSGVSYIEASLPDGKPYTFYAYTDRNPRLYKFLFAYKNGELVENFTDYIQAPGRLEIREMMGSGAIWGIPIEGFALEPGCLYEFGFYRGMQANNGITLVFSDDGKGYIQNPSTDEEIAKYEAEKYQEFEFVSSYWVEYSEDQKDYIYDFHLVPMRFSIQTYADVSAWYEGRKEAENFLASVTAADYENGIYVERNVENMRTKLAELDAEIENEIRMLLQPDATQMIDLMLGELEIALKKAKSPKPEGADLTDLKAALKEARIVHREGSKKIGTGLGEYNAEALERLAAQIAIAEKITAADTQADVNTATDNLREAITRVYASVVREESLILFDNATNIKMVIPVSAVTAETVLFVKRFAAEDTEFSSVLQLLNIPAERLALYNIKLYDKDVVIDPLMDYSMQIPVLESQRQAILYHIDADGKAQLIETAYADGFKILSERYTGLFALVLPEAEPEEPPIVEPPIEDEPTPPEPPVEEPPVSEPENPPVEDEPTTPVIPEVPVEPTVPIEPDEPEPEDPPQEQEPEDDDKHQLVDTTDDEIKDTPDNTEQEVNPEDGEIYVPERIEEDELRSTTGPAYPIVIPLAQISTDTDELPIITILLIILLAAWCIFIYNAYHNKHL